MIKKTILGALTFVLLINVNMHAQPIVVKANKPVADIQPTMWGIFFEDINFAADGGIYAELVKNRSFEFDTPLMGWHQPNSDRHSLNLASGMATIIKTDHKSNRNYARIQVNDCSGYQLINEGFRGMGIKENGKYTLSLKARQHGSGITDIIVQLIDPQGKVLGETKISPQASEWKNYEAILTATATEPKANLKITFEGNGVVDLDMISLFPDDTWMGRPGGMRKDIVQLLADMKPGFLRFPGGCIVEGRTLAERYQWKKTVGDVENRELIVNRWNTEFRHRPTPDYYQSFGLGFFEYFQLAEDMGAEPLPILNCGMACQFNTGELVPLNEIDPYVKDALDLIEFANGSVDSPWGKVRAGMGHPAPFNLKLLGVGNEQWGPDYFDRLKIFTEAVKAKYPEIVIVSGTGPFPDGEHFDYAEKELVKANAEIVDEHYYRSPQWFLDNADRYDRYDRNAYKVFAGEYAAQSVAIASPDNKNNWHCALAEAAYMTGLERNADVVHLTSYAPLMAHVDGWQWTPDMIWFDNLRSMGTPNYYVQKLFSTNKGSQLLPILEDGKPLTGKDNLYASAVYDRNTREVIIKIVNSSDKTAMKEVRLEGAGKVAPDAKRIVLRSDDLEAVNTLDNPQNISPVEETFKVKGNVLKLEALPYSLTVLKIKTS